MTGADKNSRTAHLARAAFVVLAAEAVLVSLGVWQLRRLAWKQNIIAQIEARASAPAVSLPEFAQWPNLRPEDYEYRHVLLRGSFENDKAAFVFRPSGGATGVREPGYLIMTPLRLDSGAYVIVNRGFAPAAPGGTGPRPYSQIDGPAILTGLMRAPESRNLFTPADDPEAGQYFTRDPSVVAARFHLARTAPFIVDAAASPMAESWPRGGATELSFPNNHLSYAATWFGLAAALAGVFFAYAWRFLRAGGNQ